MASFTYGIGKGLVEPCSPFRLAYFFGAGLNEPNADRWNCVPKIADPTTTFDLGALIPGHEVVVALLGISNTHEGRHYIRFRWYRERDNALLFDYTWSFTATEGGWLYGYSFIGYVDWEINENGDYYVKIDVSGADTYSRTIDFSVSGIGVVTPPPVIITDFMEEIVGALNETTSFFYAIYVETFSWISPFNYIAGLFYSLSWLFNKQAWAFYSFSEWVYEVTGKVTQVFNWTTIWSYLLALIPNLEDIRDWFYYWPGHVRDVITSWWNEKRQEVLSWIEEAKSYASSLFDQANTWLSSLQEDWDSFKGMIPTLDEIIYWWSNWQEYLAKALLTWWRGALTEIQGLINSAFTEREPFWAGWQDWRDKVTEFFSDPEEWLYKAADRIIERFW